MPKTTIFTSLQGKICILLITLAIIPALFIGLVANNRANMLLDTSIRNSHADKVTRIADRIDQYLQDGKTTVTTLSKVASVSEMGSDAQSSILKSFYDGSGMFELVFCTNAQGTIVNSWPKSDFGGKSDFSDRQWYKDVRDSQKTIISDTYLSAFTQQATAPIVAPLFDASGQIIGYIGGNIKLDNVTALAKELNFGDTGKSIVLDKKNFYLTDSRDDQAGKQHLPFDDQNILQLIQTQKTTATYLDDNLAAFAPIGQSNWSVLSFQNKSETMSSADDLQKLIIIVIIIASSIVGLIGYFAIRKLSRPIASVAAIASQIAAGQIVSTKIAYAGRDEIRLLINSFSIMSENLQKLISRTSQAINSVTTSSKHLASSSQQSALASEQIALSANEVATGSEKQMQTVTEAVTLVQAITATLQQIIFITNTVVESSNETAQSALKGKTEIVSAVDQMKNIKETVEHLAQVVAKLGEQSGTIGQIIDTISTIAKQTNLLALNAAIEAARAGEQGHGFAVVAAEVKTLAEQSSLAAKEITELITTMQTDSNAAVTAMSEGIKQVQVGSEVVNSAGETFKTIVTLINGTTTKITNVAGDIQLMSQSNEQITTCIKGIEEISKQNSSHMQSISAATQEQSAALEDIASSSQSLQNMMGQVQATINEFTIIP